MASFLRNKGGGLSHNHIIGMSYINYMLKNIYIYTHTNRYIVTCSLQCYLSACTMFYGCVCWGEGVEMEELYSFLMTIFTSNSLLMPA